MLETKLKGHIAFYTLETIPLLTELTKTVEEDEELLWLVWDDVVADLDSKNIKKVANYFIAGRKCNLSQWILTQSYFRLPKIIRQQCGYLALLKLSSNNDLALVLRDFSLGVTPAELTEIYKDATKERLNMLKLDIMATDPNKKFSKNFTQFYRVENDSDED